MPSRHFPITILRSSMKKWMKNSQERNDVAGLFPRWFLSNYQMAFVKKKNCKYASALSLNFPRFIVRAFPFDAFDIIERANGSDESLASLIAKIGWLRVTTLTNCPIAGARRRAWPSHVSVRTRTNRFAQVRMSKASSNSLEIEILEREVNFYDSGCFHSSSQDVLFRGLVISRS